MSGAEGAVDHAGEATRQLLVTSWHEPYRYAASRGCGRSSTASPLTWTNSPGPDLALTIHPHPTLSETIGLAAEAFEGTITDLYLPKQK
jgi:hypothetical protein